MTKSRFLGRLLGAMAASVLGAAFIAVGPGEAAPRMRIAIGRIDETAIASAYPGGDVARHISDQLATALVQAGTFIVLERDALSEVAAEQALGIRGASSAESAPEVGRIVGAQILLLGSITEFAEDEVGSSTRLGVIGKNGVFGIGTHSTSGHLALDIRLVDTTTGRDFASNRAAAAVRGRRVVFHGDHGRLQLEHEAFATSALGLATRQAIEQTVAFIKGALRDAPWSGRVVEVEGRNIYVNAGAADGLAMGDTLVAIRIARKLTDPETGMSLGVIEKPLGKIVVVSVAETYAVGRAVGASLPKRNDLVRQIGQRGVRS